MRVNSERRRPTQILLERLTPRCMTFKLVVGGLLAYSAVFFSSALTIHLIVYSSFPEPREDEDMEGLWPTVLIVFVGPTLCLMLMCAVACVHTALPKLSPLQKLKPLAGVPVLAALAIVVIFVLFLVRSRSRSGRWSRCVFAWVALELLILAGVMVCSFRLCELHTRKDEGVDGKKPCSKVRSKTA